MNEGSINSPQVHHMGFEQINQVRYNKGRPVGNNGID